MSRVPSRTLLEYGHNPIPIITVSLCCRTNVGRNIPAGNCLELKSVQFGYLDQHFDRERTPKLALNPEPLNPKPLNPKSPTPLNTQTLQVYPKPMRYMTPAPRHRTYQMRPAVGTNFTTCKPKPGGSYGLGFGVPPGTI